VAAMPDSEPLSFVPIGMSGRPADEGPALLARTVHADTVGAEPRGRVRNSIIRAVLDVSPVPDDGHMH
jgi:hypothetical protein